MSASESDELIDLDQEVRNVERYRAKVMHNVVQAQKRKENADEKAEQDALRWCTKWFTLQDLRNHERFVKKMRYNRNKAFDKIENKEFENANKKSPKLNPKTQKEKARLAAELEEDSQFPIEQDSQIPIEEDS